MRALFPQINDHLRLSSLSTLPSMRKRQHPLPLCMPSPYCAGLCLRGRRAGLDSLHGGLHADLL